MLWFLRMLSRVLIVKIPSLQSGLGVPPNCNLVSCIYSNTKAWSSMMILKNFEQTSTSITPLHLFRFNRSPDFGTRTHSLLCHPSWFALPSQKLGHIWRSTVCILHPSPWTLQAGCCSAPRLCCSSVYWLIYWIPSRLWDHSVFILSTSAAIGPVR